MTKKRKTKTVWKAGKSKSKSKPKKTTARRRTSGITAPLDRIQTFPVKTLI